MTQTSTASSTGADVPRTERTRTLLTCGIVAGPVFVLVAGAQILTRDGFDLRRHAISMLSLGDLGWIQMTTFVLTGLLTVACAVGMRGALRSGRGGSRSCVSPYRPGTIRARTLTFGEGRV